ncbi:MAG TPA: NfeD family protein [Steroidobacteraceae bacterium]|jgi:membrane protein implicated in regulation of membrane protease activity|nr:NfeD family protein [Steroidobacteraceae bacterium]
MQWWAWIAVGAILLGSELAFVDAQFYLVIVGGSALVVGMLGAGGLSLAVWLQWSLFAVLALGSMVTFRRRIYEKLRPSLPGVKAGPAGDILTLPAVLPPGESCRVEYRGSSWNATNGGSTVIAAGARVRVDRVDGLCLIVHAI